MKTPGASQQKSLLCHLLRSTGSCFIDGTTGQSPGQKRDAAILRHQLDCLITLFESGNIDPVDLLQSAALEPHPEDASLLAVS